MSINLTIEFEHTEAVSNSVRYARIDNIVTPSYVNVSPNPITSPATIATNIPNGQYQIESTPVYADGRVCSPTIVQTPACPGLLSINVEINSGNLIVSYLAPFDVPKVRITVNYPNGGSFIANYVNDGNNIVIPLPSGVTGDFSVSGQSVCDESSGFYSSPSSQVVVSITTDNVSIVNTAAGITINSITGISGFTLSTLVTTGNSDTGTHAAFFGAISGTFTGVPTVGSSVNLQINGVIVQCQNLPNTNGGTINFFPTSVASNDIILIQFQGGYCPASGIPGSYRYASSEGTLCGELEQILYTPTPFAVGVPVFTDVNLTVLLTTFSFISVDTFGFGTIYNINSVTGVVGSPTGNSC